MATVSIVFGNWHSKQPVMSRHNQTEAITSSGTAQTSSNTGTAGDDCVEVATSGGAVWVALDGNDASSTNGYMLPDGTTRTFDAGFGTTVSVKDV